jgi:hypothetical protein
MSRKMKSGKGTSAPRKKVSKVLLTAAQIGKGELETLGKQIKAHVEKMRGYEARAQEKAGVELHKADNHRNTIAQLLTEAMAKCDSGGFKAFQEKYCPDLKRSRIYELLAIGSGKKTLEESRAEKRASVAKNRGKVSATSAPVADKSKVEPVKETPLASGASGEAVGVTPEDQPPAPRVDKSDKPDIKRPVPKPKAPVEPVTASVSPAGREADPPASDTVAERKLENEIFDLKAEIEELKAKCPSGEFLNQVNQL